MLADVKCQNSVSTDQCHTTVGSSVQLIEVACFVKFSADQLWYLRDRRRRKQPKKYYSEKFQWELRFWPWLNLYNIH